MKTKDDHVSRIDRKMRMNVPPSHLKRGDLVEVRSAAEILATLDSDGALDGLPFMPEMIPFIGKRFTVSRRVEKTCLDYPSQTFRRFQHNDVVFLESLRCSGEAHGACQRGCMLFWKEAWLRKVDNVEENGRPEPKNAFKMLGSRLKTRAQGEVFICQSARLEQATEHIPPVDRIKVSFAEIQNGNRKVFEVIGMFVRTAFWKLRGKLLGTHPRGTLKSTPTESLNLQPGDWVEVKPYEEIYPTLDAKGRNRGMKFDLDMKFFCGERHRVSRRLDRMIREDTGKMLHPKNTVLLDRVNCQCIFATGGCPRAEAFYWREIWLKRVDGIPRQTEHGSP